MVRVKKAVRLLAISLTIVASGCSADSFDKRYGLKPTLDAADVKAATQNKTGVLLALAEDAGVGYPTFPRDYYLIAEAGFNYIDDQCNAYFDQLFYLDRKREALKSGVASFGQTTNAILQLTGASKLSIGVVAQAFGLAYNMTDVVTGTYLYQLPPATTQSFVKQLQTVFRKDLASRPGDISNPTSAYHAIQQYLDLCLPPTIEANIVKHLSSATVVSTGTGSGVTVMSATTPATVPPAEPAPRTNTAQVTVSGASNADLQSQYDGLCKRIGAVQARLARYRADPNPPANNAVLIASAEKALTTLTAAQSALQTRSTARLVCR